MKPVDAPEEIQIWEKCLYYLHTLCELVLAFIFNLIWAVCICFIKFFVLFRSICPKKREQNPFQKLKSSKINKKILMLDLDGTLIYTSQSQKTNGSKIFINGKSFFVHQRPFLNEFLCETKKLFCLGVYTSSTQDYADQVIRLIGLEKDIPKNMRFYRNHCKVADGNYVKMLTRVEADLRNVLILDNRPEVIMDKRNIIKIRSWEGGEDNELIESLQKLKRISMVEDVRFYTS